MKIETINELLIDVISKTSKITTKNPNQPVLENVLIETIDDNTLRITSYNLDIFYTQDIFVKTIEKSKYNKICVNPNIILSYLNLFDKNNNVLIEILNNSIKLKIKDQESIIQAVEARDYPDLKSFYIENKEGLIINSDILIDGVQSVSFSAALSSIKPEFSCVLISLDEDVMNFVTTDGFRLTEKNISIDNINIDNIDNFRQILITAKNINDLLKIIYSNISISIFVEKGLFYVKTSDSLLCVRTVSGSYPNYKNIIPKDFITEMEVETDDINNALKASNIFSDDFNYVKLEIKDNEIDFYSKNNRIGESFSKKNIIKTGENITQNYNHRYLSDFLNKIKTDKVILKISGKTTPTVIKPKGDNTYTYMVMPMNK